ncbi:hypothetical protein [Nocardia wallacei]|uniref:hypothetical protein n=1 Tax=Nocardia wallacei TaxID=480035 RepID=UPI0024555FF6|nr:hypothetical protein [Nocardia wallacei]
MDNVLLTTEPMLPSHPFLEPVPRTAADTNAFADSSDRLVRHLFDVGLQLHTLRAVFDRPGATAVEVEAVGVLVDNLDMLIRDAGLAMLALSLERGATGNGRPVRRRRRHRFR